MAGAGGRSCGPPPPLPSKDADHGDVATALDGPIRYTVRVTSKQFGNSQETRTIRSGQSDDFTWKTVPPGGAVPTPMRARTTRRCRSTRTAQ